MTTTVTIELSDRDIERSRYVASNPMTTEPVSIGAILARKVTEALPDPDEELVYDMLAAYCEAASLRGPTRDALNARMAEGMKAVLELLRERDAS